MKALVINMSTELKLGGLGRRGDILISQVIFKPSDRASNQRVSSLSRKSKKGCLSSAARLKHRSGQGTRDEAGKGSGEEG